MFPSVTAVVDMFPSLLLQVRCWIRKEREQAAAREEQAAAEAQEAVTADAVAATPEKCAEADASPREEAQFRQRPFSPITPPDTSSPASAVATPAKLCERQLNRSEDASSKETWAQFEELYKALLQAQECREAEALQQRRAEAESVRAVGDSTCMRTPSGGKEAKAVGGSSEKFTDDKSTWKVSAQLLHREVCYRVVDAAEGAQLPLSGFMSATDSAAYAQNDCFESGALDPISEAGEEEKASRVVRVVPPSALPPATGAEVRPSPTLQCCCYLLRNKESHAEHVLVTSLYSDRFSSHSGLQQFIFNHRIIINVK